MIINLEEVVKGVLIIPLIFFLILNLNLVQAENLGTYPEAIIKYDFSSKNFIVTSNNSADINVQEKCLNKKCSKKIENYVLVDENNNKLILKLDHFESNNQNSVEILSLKYNDNEMKIVSNRFITKDSTNYLNQDLYLGKTRVYLDFNKKTNKTTIRINENGKQSTKTQKGLILGEIIISNDNFYYKLINISKDNNNFIKVNWKQIGCNWRPSNKDKGCQEFGGTFHEGVCSNGDAILGFYFDGNKCIIVSGFGIEGNFNLFMNSKECEEKCLPKPKKIDCSWRPPVNDSNICLTIFGDIYDNEGILENCKGSKNILGYYYNGERCAESRGNEIKDKIKLFSSSKECNEQCVNDEKMYCQADSDCIPSSCCFSWTLGTINKNFAPNCDKVLCIYYPVLFFKKCAKSLCIDNRCNVVQTNKNPDCEIFFRTNQQLDLDTYLIDLD
jgi:hypothetical protein